MSIQSDFAAYTNALGFVSNKPNGSSGNDIMFSCEAALVRKKASAWTLEDDAALGNAIEKNARLEPGLYGRPGWMQDQEQPDDYYGLVAWNPFYARAIAAYGQKHFWCFKSSPAAKWYEPMFFRWPALIAHSKWASGAKPNAFLRLWWAGSVAFSGSKSDQDSWKINRLLISVAGDKGALERWATRRFFARLKANWGSMKAVYTAYFGAEHPIAKYCQE